VSAVRPDIDLAGLTRAPAPSTRLDPPRRSLWRIVLPLAILLTFLGVLATNLQGLFQPSTAVSIVRPRALGEGRPSTGPGQGQGRVVLQAAGWIEPDPFAIQVSALTAGIVREVRVLEASTVTRGQVIATLVDDDARLEVQGAEALLAEAEASLAEARARAAAAEEAFSLALQVVEREALARADLEGRRAEALGRESAAKSGEAAVSLARDELALQRELLSLGAVDARQVDIAEARLTETQGALEQLRAEVALAAAEVRKSEAAHVRAVQDRATRIEDRLSMDTAAAASKAAEARLAAARVGLETARLALARTEVTAPADGVVLERLAMPGSAVDPAGSAVLCTLFDPQSLRLRVDVPQSDVFRLAVGGRAEILIEGRAGQPYAGEIVRVVQKADIQKVTLQVHVRIEGGDGRLRPEMLAQARFLSTDAPGAPETGSGPGSSVEIPARVVENGRSVWIVDGVSGRAKRREISLAAGAETAGADQWVLVLSGLDLSDKVIDRGRQDLTEGARLRLEGQP
jgi:HlyD family secretion protein